MARSILRGSLYHVLKTLLLLYVFYKKKRVNQHCHTHTNLSTERTNKKSWHQRYIKQNKTIKKETIGDERNHIQVTFNNNIIINNHSIIEYILIYFIKSKDSFYYWSSNINSSGLYGLTCRREVLVLRHSPVAIHWSFIWKLLHQKDLLGLLIIFSIFVHHLILYFFGGI